jgi:D-beta-D-heptose 7-phosphate kinase/D-beta-D-heptose 1-phosphate adenosyltransferase
MTDLAGLQRLAQKAYARVRQHPARIAVLGDMILDNSIEGEPRGFHPETRVPVLGDATSQESVGGAANIATALQKLGCQVTLFGVIGGDLPGRQLENLLDRQPFTSYLVTERGWPTPRKDWIYRRHEGRVEMIQRIDYDRPLSPRAREELVGEFRVRCPEDVEVVILADHGLGCIGPETLAVIGLAKERGAKLVAIPRTAVLRGQPVDAIVINAFEMRRLAEADQDDAKLLAARYARDYKQHVFLTLFDEGVFVCTGGQREAQGTLCRGIPMENPDWMGARDITTVVVALGLSQGLKLEEIGRLAVVFRYLVASQRGNGRVLWPDVFRFLRLEPVEAW